MTSEPPAAGILAQHGKALVQIGVVSAIGILASAGFQILAIRSLGPTQFGLLASFLALINIAAIGSAALRNSVAVTTAESTPVAPSGGRRRLDSAMVEALVLGITCTVGLLVASPWLAGSLVSNIPALLLTAVTITPYFIFSRAQGLLQGGGDSRSVVWWSSGAQVLQVVLSLLAVLLGFGALGILGAVLLTAVIGTVGASLQARQFARRVVGRAFSVNSTVVLLITIAFAWLTSVDVILVRSDSPHVLAGSYAAAAVLIKTTLIIPATLSLYLLPRFVQRRGDHGVTRFGVNVTLGITFASGIAMFVLVLLLGPLLVSILYGSEYNLAASYLPWFALMWIPWATAQAMLIQLTAAASKAALAVLVIVVAIQWIGARFVLPNIFAWMTFDGILGLVALGALFMIYRLSARKSRLAEPLVSSPTTEP